MKSHKDIVLDSVSQMSIISRYFGQIPTTRKKYKNPFREDNVGSCYFINKNGTIYFVDPTYEDYGGDCFSICMLRNGCDFKTAIKIISKDFNIPLSNTCFTFIHGIPEHLKTVWHIFYLGLQTHIFSRVLHHNFC